MIKIKDKFKVNKIFLFDISNLFHLFYPSHLTIRYLKIGFNIIFQLGLIIFYF